jgi:cytochrome c oxidase subunit 1
MALLVLFIGFWVLTIPQYALGLLGMPRRVARYPPNLGWQFWNVIPTVGAYLIGASFLFFLVNLCISWRRPVPAGANPWDGQTLEWYTTSPPSHHNVEALPPIRSERPVWEVNHPDHPTIKRSSPRKPTSRPKEKVGARS